MNKKIVFILILIIGFALGVIVMFLFSWRTTYMQGMFCPATEIASPNDVWEEVEFPEYENPFEETTVNPFEEVYTNPFDKLGE